MRAQFLVVLLLAAFSAAAQSLYKWVDEKGVTHYSQQPPEKGEASKIEVKVEPAHPAPSDDWKARDLESKRKKVQSDVKERAEEARRKIERQASCDRARSQLDMLRNARRIYNLDAKGDRVYVEDDKRPAMVEKAQGDVREFCS